MSTRTTQEVDPEIYRAYHRRRDAERRQRREELRTSVLVETRAAIRRVAPRYPAIRAVHLFGSLLEPERFRVGSDVDLALEIDDLEQEGPFARALEEALGRPVDVRPFVGPIRRTVEQGGETVYEREDPGSCL